MKVFTMVRPYPSSATCNVLLVLSCNLLSFTEAASGYFFADNCVLVINLREHGRNSTLRPYKLSISTNQSAFCSLQLHISLPKHKTKRTITVRIQETRFYDKRGQPIATFRRYNSGRCP